jgi:hypothetical protein
MATKPKTPAKSKVPKSPEELRKEASNKALSSIYTPGGVNAGNALIDKFAKPGQFGRVGTINDNGGDNALMAGQVAEGKRASELLGQAGRSGEESEALAKMQAGLGGYTSPEYQASREQMMRGQQSNFRTSQGQLAKAQARGKVYGAAGAAQQANLAASSQQSKDNLEQDLMVKNIDEQRSRLAEYGNYGASTKQAEFGRQGFATDAYNKLTTGQRDEELGREKTNIGQANAEIASQVALQTGAGATALAQKNAQMSDATARMGINKAVPGGIKSKASDKAKKNVRK